VFGFRLKLFYFDYFPVKAEGDPGNAVEGFQITIVEAFKEPFYNVIFVFVNHALDIPLNNRSVLVPFRKPSFHLGKPVILRAVALAVNDITFEKIV